MDTVANSDQQLNPAKLSVRDLPDIQGLIVRGYNMPRVRHFVLTIGDPAATAAFLGELTSGNGALGITSAAPWRNGAKPSYALNFGVTATGLEALRLPGPDADPSAKVVFNRGNFQSFLGGAIAAAATVGDTGDNAPSNWISKLNEANASAAHLMLSLYTASEADRDNYSTILRTMFSEVIPPAGKPDNDVLEFDVDAMPGGKIHFGYSDGISNPVIDAQDLPPLRKLQLPYVPAWQFVLREGSMTSYNMPTPLALSQNASFSAFRILEQDVDAFDAFLKRQGDSAAQELTAAKMCGRWRNGNPLVACPDTPGDEKLPFDELQDFLYNQVAGESGEPDSIGGPCPYSAHTRRVNARGGPGVTGVHNTEEGRQAHRIMRRANPYGPAHLGKADGKARGLAGHFIGASLFNQFEFLMGQWVNSGTFAGIRKAGIDPLIGNVPEGSTLTYWKKEASTGEQVPVTVKELPRVVTTKGGLYLMLPSLTSIKWMAANGNNANPWTITNNAQ